MAQPSPAPADTQKRPRLHTPGFSDILGDRLLTFDNSTASSLELLRFKREFSDAPGFEAALGARVEQLSHLRHPSVGTVRGVEWLGAGEGLALVSHHTAGRRLSEVLQDARGPAFALELIRQLAPALSAIHRHAPGLAHGLLTPDRIIVTREGRLVLVEHALASAIDALHLPARRVQADFGIAMPAVDDIVLLDARTDMTQLGFIALSLLLGRRLDPAGYPASLTALLDEYAREDPAASARLRGWLERALQIGPDPFRSAEEAHRAFERLPEEPKPEPVAAPQLVDVSPSPAAAASAVPSSRGAAGVPPAPTTERPSPTPVHKSGPAPRDPAVHQAVIAGAAPAAKRRVRANNAIRWAVGVLAVVAVAEGVIIAGRWLTAPVVVMGPPSPLADLSTPPPPAPVPPVAAAAVTPPPANPVADAKPTPAPVENTPAPAPPPPPAGRFGGVRITSPIELQVFEGGALVGSTAGPIAVADGRHVFDLINETLAYRSQKTVEVKAGQMVAVSVTLPNGRISINAAPWAEVSINGTPAGQTPIANHSIPIGTHEIVFRHPQLGERRHSVVVKAEGITRVSASFQP